MFEQLLRGFGKAGNGGSDTAVCRVKFSQDGDGWKTDKTYEEVLAAYRSGAHVEAEVPNDGMPDEVLLIPLVAVNTSKWLASLAFHWERVFVPAGGYGDVTVSSVNAVMQPGSSYAEYSMDVFPACKCGRDPEPV